MKTANGYLELDNLTPGANNLTLTIIERLDDGGIRQAIAKIDPAELGALTAQILSLRGIPDEVDQQRPAKIVERVVEVIKEVPARVDPTPEKPIEVTPVEPGRL